MTETDLLKMIQAVIDKYGEDEALKKLQIDRKTLWNYKKGGNPNKTKLKYIQETYEKLSGGGGEIDTKDKYIALLEKQNDDLQRKLDLSLGEIRHNMLLSRAIAEVTQSLVIEMVAKQRKEDKTALGAAVGKANYERYEKVRAEGNFAEIGK